ncbi:MAG TPA: hypothetical protein VG710_17655 [Opitutus sp.]|nr:hypothetical protein [Opitutus sp.]
MNRKTPIIIGTAFSGLLLALYCLHRLQRVSVVVESVSIETGKAAVKVHGQNLTNRPIEFSYVIDLFALPPRSNRYTWGGVKPIEAYPHAPVAIGPNGQRDEIVRFEAPKGIKTADAIATDIVWHETPADRL